MKLAIACLIACAGCASYPTDDKSIEVFIDSGFGAHQVSLLQDSIGDWQAAVGNVITLSLTDNATAPGAFIFIGPTTQAEVSFEHADQTGGAGEAGFWSYEGDSKSLVQVATDLGDDGFQQTAEHEIGHALGLQHTGAGTIMAPSANETSDRVSCADMAQFCDMWDCDAKATPICLN